MGLLIAFLTMLLLGHLSQYLTAKAIHPKARPPELWLLQICSMSIVFTTYLLITQRPILSGILTLILFAVFLVVNHAKYTALREPLVFSDIYLYIQVVRHPRLFLPFLNLPLTLFAILAGVALLYLAIWLEPTVTIDKFTLYLSGGLLIGGSIYAVQKIAQTHFLTFHPDRDARESGFFNSLIIYALQAHSKTRLEQFQQRIQQLSPYTDTLKGTPDSGNPPEKPSDIVVIQSESFFDPRRLYEGINPKILENFDRICRESISYGTLGVPSWGANTLRPEFAFLSGIDNTELEHYRFNPYQYLRDNPTPTIASYLKTLGYRCIAIHPNEAGFFGRDKVFPLFGFDEFIDITSFDINDKSGPYISDHAVQVKISEIIDRHDSEQPLFIFAITMENHGPLHLETVTDSDVEALYQDKSPQKHEDLTVYLRHLSNADLMLKKLTDQLRDRDRKSLLCFYGDHVPSMPGVYEELEFRDGRSDYLVWQHRSTTRNNNLQNHIDIQNLSKLLFQQ